ncbi:DUF4198 domain-containing protein [Caenimonas terrae]|uniref:DUF4198 domain-containing protein n=1 Tax=Caenimonas terrae TaxID=696074 RepID=A0ABW0N991_9BURK
MSCGLLRRAALVLVAWAACLSANAHEFWIEASPPAPAVGAPVLMTARVGEFYTGELVGITTAHVVSLHALSAGRDEDLDARVPTGSMVPALRLSFAQPGSHVLAYESHPSQVVLAADKFHAYLHDEGMDWVIRQREAAGTAATPGRERFRRSAKALLQVGGQGDGAATAVTGQRMEILPLDDPLAAHAGDTLHFQLRFEGRPRPGVLVKAWHKQGGQTTTIRATTDGSGRFAFTLPFTGRWMLNAVHMVAATDSTEVDWDSFWGSLTFQLQPRPPAGG